MLPNLGQANRPQTEPRTRRKRMLDTLRQAGLLTKEQAASAMEPFQGRLLPVDEQLEKMGYLTSGETALALANFYGYELAALDHWKVDPSLSTVVPAEIAQKHALMPFGWKDSELLIAMADPSDVMAEDSVRRTTFRPCKFFVAPEGRLLRLMEQLY